MSAHMTSSPPFQVHSNSSAAPTAFTLSSDTRDKLLTTDSSEITPIIVPDSNGEAVIGGPPSSQPSPASGTQRPLMRLVKSVTHQRLERFLSAADSTRMMDVEFRDMVAAVEETPGSKQMKTILKRVSGHIKAGEIVALMGPSGAGKSTLLNALGGRFEGQFCGEVFLNGRPMSKKYKKHMGYVLQTDSMLTKLTVFETLTITAKLRLPENMPSQNKQQRVEDIMHIMGLIKCRDTLLQDVSGGEKKRTSIANELLMNPSVIFLDEPTSGLDSTSAFSILSTLRQLSCEGRTIVCAIHQPSSQMFAMFDRLYLLSDGHCIYDGIAAQCTDYLSQMGFECPIHYNPADFILELSTSDFESENVVLQDKERIQQKLISTWKESGESVKAKQSAFTALQRAKHSMFEQRLTDDSPVEDSPVEKQLPAETRALSPSTESDDDSMDSESKYAVSWWTQFTILFFRGFKVRRGNVFEKLRFVEMIGVGLLGGLIFFRIPHTEENMNDWLGATFFIQIFTNFSAMFRGISYFPMELPVIKRERQSGAYSLSSYYLSKVVSEFPVDVVLPVLMVAIYFWLVGMGDNAANYVLYLLATCCGVFTANAYGTCLGCAFKNFNDAMTTLALTGITFMLISGFYVKDRAIPVWISWLGYVSHMRWSFLLTLLIVVKDNSFKCADENKSEFDECNRGDWTRIAGNKMMKKFGTRQKAWFAFLMLCILSVLWHSLAYFFLKKNTGVKAMVQLEDASEMLMAADQNTKAENGSAIELAFVKDAEIEDEKTADDNGVSPFVDEV